MFWSNLLRDIIGFFDVIIYGFIDNVYNTFTNIASYTLINNKIIDTFTQRIYIIVGIFMLFKMAFSLINYFVDPDKITDSKNGFGNLVQRIIISLVMLVLVPTIFNIAFYAQTIILNENILANIILGGSYDEINSGSFVDTYENAGKKMAFSVLSAFVAPKDLSVITMTTEEEIEKEFEGEEKEIESYKKYLEVRDNNNISGLVGMNGIKNNEDDGGNYIYNYTAGLSTLAGVLVLLTLLSFCVDIGVRAAKLVFLQLVAPIPVLSYIDASKGKDVFNKWVKNCVSTYLDVFVRLLAIYFVIFIITLITQNGFTLYTYTLKGGEITTTEVQNVDLFAQALIIIGLLIFAKEVPALLEEILGIKLSGKFSLNPMKRITESPLAAGVVGGAIGGIFGGASSAISNYQMHKKLGHGTGQALGSAGLGLFSGARRGVIAGSKEKTLAGMRDKALDKSSVGADKILAKRGTGAGVRGMWDRSMSKVQNKMGMMTKADKLEAKSQALGKYMEGYSKAKKASESEVDKGGADKLGYHVKEKKAVWDSLQAVDINHLSSSRLADLERQQQEAAAWGHAADYDEDIAAEKQRLADEHNAKMTAAEKEYWAERKAATAGYMTYVMEGGNPQDVDTITGITEMQKAYKDDPDFFTYMDDSGKEHAMRVDFSTGESIVEANKTIVAEKTRLDTSEEMARAKDLRTYGETAGGRKATSKK